MIKWILIALLCASNTTYANTLGDPVKGKLKAPSCIFCHGETGKAMNSSYPNLDMQNEMYLYNSMKSYQNDERKGPLAQMMKAQLQRLNDQDLKDIAAFYANASNSENK